MGNKERNNIIIKLSRRAKCSLTIVRTDTVPPNTSTYCFFSQEILSGDPDTDPSVPHWKSIFFLKELNLMEDLNSKYVLIVRDIIKLNKTILLLPIFSELAHV